MRWILLLSRSVAVISVFSAFLPALRAQDGLPGANGDPGQAGFRAGSTAERQAWRQGEGPGGDVLSLQGATGFQGGKGGDGVDGDDPFTDADGGMGGTGGNGGNASATWDGSLQPNLPWEQARHRGRVRVEATGGNAGSGGSGGSGTGGGRNGINGQDGYGGTAFAQGSAGRDLVLISQGGGGSIGGSALFRANLIALASRPPGPNEQLTLGVWALGGHGLDSYSGNGGEGASVSLGSPVAGTPGQLSYVRVRSPFFYRADLNLRGGAGGVAALAPSASNSTVPRSGGFGGAVDVYLPSLFGAEQMGVGPSVGRVVNLALTGGKGGDGSGSAAGSRSGNTGGRAMIWADSSLPAVNLGRGSINFGLYGGRGGNAIGTAGLFTGSAGSGGNALLDLPDALVSAVGGSVVTATLLGGRGGDSTGTGQGGMGGGVLAQMTRLAGSVRTFSLVAFGGNGGHGGTGGNGGAATARALLDQAFPAPTLQFDLHTMGGWGGRGTQASGNGGTARSNFSAVIAPGSTSLTARVSALAGRSNGGRAGLASAWGSLFAGDSAVLLELSAAPAAGQNLQGITLPMAAFGSDADASGEAFTDSDRNAETVARADGGFGSFESGWAKAFARAENTGGGNAIARSFATARGDNSPSSPNHALAHSVSRSNGVTAGSAFSRSEAHALGQFNYANAYSQSTSVAPVAISVATSATTAIRHSAQVEATARHVGVNRANQTTIDSLAESSFRRGDILHRLSNEQEEAWASLVVLPRYSVIDSQVTLVGLRETFRLDGPRGPADEVNQVIALGLMGGGSTGGGEAGSNRVDLRFALDFDLVPGIHDQDNLWLGLLGTSQTNAGFDSLRFMVQLDDRTIVDQSFADPSLARDWFSGRTFDLGSSGSLVGQGRNLLVTWESTHNNQVVGFFGSGFVFGIGSSTASFQTIVNAIPEPGAAACLGMVSLCLVVVRAGRKRLGPAVKTGSGGVRKAFGQRARV